MPKKYVDISIYQTRNREKDGNIDFGYWQDKTIEERHNTAAPPPVLPPPPPPLIGDGGGSGGDIPPCTGNWYDPDPCQNEADYSQATLDAFANSLGWYWEDAAYDSNSTTYPPYDANVDGPYDAQGFHKSGPVYQYYNGTVQNYMDDHGGKYAIFTPTLPGPQTIFPGATITNFGTLTSKGVTTANGGIHVDNTCRLRDLQHEYGHYLQAQAVGATYYYGQIVPASLLSAATTGYRVHRAFWTEIDANHYAILFFGPTSDIAKDDIDYPR